MRIPAGIHQNDCKTVRKRAIFAYKTLVSLENQQKWTFNLRKCAIYVGVPGRILKDLEGSFWAVFTVILRLAVSFFW